MNRYYCGIIFSDSEKILLFNLYDDNEKLIYHGSNIVSESCAFNPTYCDNVIKKNKHSYNYFFSITEEKFNEFLKFDYRKMNKSKKNFFKENNLEEFLL
jgi:hypothetical protein